MFRMLVAEQKCRFLLLSAFVLCWSVLFCGCDRKEEKEIVRDLGAAWFQVSADELGTAANGVIEVCVKEKNVLGVRILAEVQIGPADFGGVAFSLPNGCRLERVACTWPESNDAPGYDQPVNVLTTAGDSEKYTTVVEIGRRRDKIPIGGGTGTVVIEASVPWNGSDRTTALSFGADCGAMERNGYVIMGIDHREIIVELKSAVWMSF